MQTNIWTDTQWKTGTRSTIATKRDSFYLSLIASIYPHDNISAAWY
jgi:hypothetical protein